MRVSAHSVTIERVKTASRAPALAPEERRAMILDAVTPLLLERGAEVTSRQIAEAAGIAEGTVFRAFGDKQSLIDAAAARYFDPERVREGLRAIDPDDPLEVKLAQMIEVFKARLSGVMRMMAALGRREHPPRPPENQGEIVARLLAPEVDRLTLSTRQVTHLVRLLAFSSVIPAVHTADTPFTTDELVQILLHGILTDREADR